MGHRLGRCTATLTGLLHADKENSPRSLAHLPGARLLTAVVLAHAQST